jgi:hypothetical protein
MRHRKPGAKLAIGRFERAPAADDEEPEIGAVEAIAQPRAGFHDDLRADAGGIAHRDGQMSFRHVCSLKGFRAKWKPVGVTKMCKN